MLFESSSPSSQALEDAARLAKEQPGSPVTRLYLAAAMQRTPLEKRWDVLSALVAHSEDAGDHNLPLMYWYAAEPLASVDASRAMKLALDSKVPPMLSFMSRRIASIGDEKSLSLLTKSLGEISEDSRRLEVLRGMAAAFAGQRDIAAPKGWEPIAGKTRQERRCRSARAFADVVGDVWKPRCDGKKCAKRSRTRARRRWTAFAALDALVRAQDKSRRPHHANAPA